MRTLALAGVVAVVWASTAHAATLCQKKSGVIVARDACKKKEAQLSLSSLGLATSGPPGPAGPTGAIGPMGPAGEAGASGTAWAWAYVLANGSGFSAFSGEVDLSVIKPQTGLYCIVPPTHYGHKGAQVTIADATGTRFASVGTGRSTVCDPYNTATTNVVPVFVKSADGSGVDADFTIVIP